MLAKRPVTQVSTHNRPKAAAPRATTPQSDALQFNPLLATRPRRSIPRPSHQHFQAAAQIARNRKGSLKNECTRFSGCLYITPPNKHRQPANQSQYSAPFKHAFWQWAMSRRRSMPCQPQYRFQAAYFFLSLAFGQCDARFVFGFVAAFGFFGRGGNRRGGWPGDGFGLGRGLGWSGRAVVVFRLRVGLGDKPLPLLLQGAADGFLFFFSGGAARRYPRGIRRGCDIPLLLGG